MSCCNSPVVKLVAASVGILVATQFINTATEFSKGNDPQTLVSSILSYFMAPAEKKDTKEEVKEAVAVAEEVVAEEKIECCGKGTCCTVAPATEEPVKQAALTCSATGEPCDCAFPINEPKKGPVCVDLSDETTKYICRCGASKKFPYCDGAHRTVNATNGTNISPLKINKEIAGKDKVWVCACGHAAGRPDSPFCDGTHNKLTDVTSPAL